MFHQVKAEEMDRLLQDLERQHGWAAALTNAGVSAGDAVVQSSWEDRYRPLLNYRSGAEGIVVNVQWVNASIHDHMQVISSEAKC